MLSDLFPRFRSEDSFTKSDSYPKTRAFVDIGVEAVVKEQAALLTQTEHRIIEPGHEIHLWGNERTVKVAPDNQGIELSFKDNDQRFEYFDTYQRVKDLAKQEGLL